MRAPEDPRISAVHGGEYVNRHNLWSVTRNGCKVICHDENAAMLNDLAAAMTDADTSFVVLPDMQEPEPLRVALAVTNV